jgi:hypothetical protein
MPQVLVTFHDGELLYAETPDLSFDLPVLEAEIRSVGSNSERGILPLVAIRQIIVGEIEPAPSADVVAGWDRAAFHFLDGQVLRASIAPQVMLGTHGGIWRVVEPGSDELRVLAVPYASLKGVFQIRQWDSRPMAERQARASGTPVHLDQMVRVLAERESRSGRRPPPRPQTPLLDRLRQREAAEEQTPEQTQEHTPEQTPER